MSIWFAIPSARPPAEAEKCLKLWRERGYKIALWLDNNSLVLGARSEDVFISGPVYPGYAQSVNALVKYILASDPAAEWIVTGGDDVDPDSHHDAGQIGHQLGRAFGERQDRFRMEAIVDKDGYHPDQARNYWSTYGVMQPTGDRWAGGSIDRICGSPWMGREFCERINQGNGPLWPEYTHMFVDEELQNIAVKLGIFRQDPNLTHLHRHYLRTNEELGVDWQAPPPEHLRNVIGSSPAAQEHWNTSKAMFCRRLVEGFPGHEPLPLIEKVGA